jgi:hypothetical protein
LGAYKIRPEEIFHLLARIMIDTLTNLGLTRLKETTPDVKKVEDLCCGSYL